jgi:excisionase family DNA binding protein
VSTSSAATEFWSDLADEIAEKVVQKLEKSPPNPAKPTRPINTLEASRRLGVTDRTLLRWAEEGCPSIRTAGGRRRWDLDAVRAWIADRDGGAR